MMQLTTEPEVRGRVMAFRVAVALGGTPVGPRVQMLVGFNEGWIEFESGEAGSRKGTVPMKSVLQTLIERAN